MRSILLYNSVIFIMKKGFFSFVENACRMLHMECRYNRRFILPAMAPSEYAFLKLKMQSMRDFVYIEYGCGGSTLLANAIFKVGYSVDSDKKWCSLIGRDLSNIHLFNVNVGEIGDWGFPAVRCKKFANDLAGAHNLKIEEIKRTQSRRVFVLIDGRCRVLTACNVFERVDLEDVVLVHDFIFRPEYYEILKLWDIVAVQGSLVQLRKKDLVSPNPIIQLLMDEYSCDFR